MGYVARPDHSFDRKPIQKKDREPDVMNKTANEVTWFGELTIFNALQSEGNKVLPIYIY
jgi:hypothetical protein